jgi:hypothetical protein
MEYAMSRMMGLDIRCSLLIRYQAPQSFSLPTSGGTYGAGLVDIGRFYKQVRASRVQRLDDFLFTNLTAVIGLFVAAESTFN